MTKLLKEAKKSVIDKYNSIEKVFPNAENKYKNEQEQKKHAQENKVNQCFKGGWSNSDWKSIKNPQEAFNIASETAKQYGVNFNFGSNSQHPFDKLSTARKFKAREVLYGANTMFETYGNVFKKAQQKNLTFSLMSQSLKGTQVIADINANGDNNHIRMYVQCEDMREYEESADTQEQIVQRANNLSRAMCHEMSHCLDRVLGDASANSSVEKPNGLGVANLIFDYVTRNIEDDKLNATIEKEVTQYATTNTTEFLAECVSIGHVSKLESAQNKDKNVLSQKNNMLVKNTYRAFNIMCEHYTKSKEGEDWLLAAMKQIQKEIP